MPFEALFYDGKSSQGHAVTIQLGITSIQINFPNENLIWYCSELNLRESFFNKNKTVLVYGAQFPYPSLEISGAEFQSSFELTYPDIKIKKTDIKIFQNTGNRTIALVILAVLGFFLLSYFVLIPETAEFVANRIPQSYEISLGEKMFEQLNIGMEVDEEQSKLANAYFQELHYEQSYPVQITVVHSNISNAFAFPGGHIVLHDEMFRTMKNKEEFSALLSHEYSHVANRHITRSLFRNLGTYLVISLVISDVNGIMAVLLQNADNLKSLSYSRSLEQEADEKGMQLMQKAGQDPQGMIRLFKHLQQADESGQKIPEFLSTHPMLEARMKNIKKLAKENETQLRENPKLDELWNQLKALNE